MLLLLCVAAAFSMAGVILETISNKQLILFTLTLLGVQIMFFIIGGTLGKQKFEVNWLSQRPYTLLLLETKYAS